MSDETTAPVPSKEPETFPCPHCGVAIAGSFVARFKDKTRLKVTLSVQDGTKIAAGTLGGHMTALDKLMRAISLDLGVKTTVFLDEIHMEPNGDVTYTVMTVANAKPKRGAPGDSAKAGG